MWIWGAIDADTKLVPSSLVDERPTQDSYVFLADLKSRFCTGTRIHLTTDAFASYPGLLWMP